MTDLNKTLDSIYQGDKSRSEIKQALLNWHNKQIEAVLDRIENSSNEADSGTEAHMMINEAIRAERKKL